MQVPSIPCTANWKKGTFGRAGKVWFYIFMLPKIVPVDTHICSTMIVPSFCQCHHCRWRSVSGGQNSSTNVPLSAPLSLSHKRWHFPLCGQEQNLTILHPPPPPNIQTVVHLSRIDERLITGRWQQLSNEGDVCLQPREWAISTKA